MKKEDAEKLLRRFRLGQCSEKELELINRWYQSFEENKIEEVDVDVKEVLKNQMFENINQMISKIEEEREFKEKSPTPVRKLYPSTFSVLKRVAAVAFILGTLISILFYNYGNSNKVNGDEISQENPIKELPSLIYLSDGSKVLLKGDSRLEYPAIFTGDIREVTLIGEAFFDVAKNKEKPFIIHAGNLTTKVLGTSFNIKAYENDESAEVEVVTGKVAVSINDDLNKREDLVLAPRQKAVYSRKSEMLKQANVTKEIQYKPETKTKLIFNETPLQEIVKVLNAYYKVNIKLENPELNQCLITAELTDEPLETSLKILTKVIGADYKINEKEITINGKGC